MDELTVEATLENLEPVQQFVEAHLEEAGCPMKVRIEISISIEEIYVNIAHYAYAPGTGTATVRCSTDAAARKAVFVFIDSGIAFDPLAKKDADITLSAEERSIGGLGILMVKKTMDEMNYERKDGKNILTMVKKF